MTAQRLVDRPETAALFLRPGGAVDARTLLADVAGLAGRLPGSGPVLNLCRDRYWFTVAFLAAVRRGRLALLCGEGAPAVLAALATRYPDAVAVVDAPATLAWPTIEAPGPAGVAENAAIPEDQLVALVFTSGSTGTPMAHEKRWGELVSRSRAAGTQFGLSEAAPASVVGTVPPGHMYGFETTVLLPLHAACASWCGPAFFPADVAAALAAAQAPRVLVTTPLQLRSLRETEVPALGFVISATAPLDGALAAEIEALWGAPVMEIFGATECGSIASRRTTQGDVWHAYPDVTIAERDGVAHANAVPLADELALLGDARFRLLGRRADVVKLGGRRASLAALNRILTAIPGVQDGIFVIPEDLDQRSTARLLAVVVAPDVSGPSILAGLRGQVDPVFLPRRVVHVDALPRNALGKLPIGEVRALLARTAVT